MRRGIWASLGIGATATVTATAVLTGLTGLAGGHLGTVAAPPAAAERLEAFGDCEQLRRWYVDAALPHVGPWGLDGGYWAQPVPLGTADRAVSATGTNVQEVGVDEPDLAKTDGSLLAHVAERRLVLTDVSGTEPRTLSTTRLPRDVGASELLLVEDRIVVLGSA
jgi:hypothetical protein